MAPFALLSPQIVNAIVPEPFGRFCALTRTVWLYFSPYGLGSTCIFGLAAAPKAIPPTARPAATAMPANRVARLRMRLRRHNCTFCMNCPLVGYPFRT